MPPNEPFDGVERIKVFTLIVGPGSGDELQGIKKGITEYALLSLL